MGGPSSKARSQRNPSPALPRLRSLRDGARGLAPHREADQSSARTTVNSVETSGLVSSANLAGEPSSDRSALTRPRSVTNHTTRSPRALRDSRYVRIDAPLETKIATAFPE